MKDLYQTSFIHLALMTLLACTNSEETSDSGQADGQQSIDTNASSPDTDDHQGGGSHGPDPNSIQDAGYSARCAHASSLDDAIFQ